MTASASQLLLASSFSTARIGSSKRRKADLSSTIIGRCGGRTGQKSQPDIFNPRCAERKTRVSLDRWMTPVGVLFVDQLHVFVDGAAARTGVFEPITWGTI